MLTQLPVKARLFGQVGASRVKSGQHIFFVHHHEAAAQVHRRSGHQFTVLNQAQFGGATANVDVQDAVLFIVRAFGSTRAVNGQHGFHVMACCGAHKLAALFGQHRCNRFTVFAAERFTGQNDRASINFVGVQT